VFSYSCVDDRELASQSQSIAVGRSQQIAKTVRDAAAYIASCLEPGLVVVNYTIKLNNHL